MRSAGTEYVPARSGLGGGAGTFQRVQAAAAAVVPERVPVRIRARLTTVNGMAALVGVGVGAVIGNLVQVLTAYSNLRRPADRRRRHLRLLHPGRHARWTGAAGEGGGGMRLPGYPHPQRLHEHQSLGPLFVFSLCLSLMCFGGHRFTPVCGVVLAEVGPPPGHGAGVEQSPDGQTRCAARVGTAYLTRTSLLFQQKWQMVILYFCAFVHLIFKYLVHCRK